MNSEQDKRGAGGRPKKAVKLDNFQGIRFTAEEIVLIRNKAKDMGMSVSKFLRQAALKATVVNKISVEQEQLLRQLAGMANNLNQIAKRGHTEGFSIALTLFGKYHERIEDLLQKFSV